ncbi:MAG: OmpA family protein [Trichlorobacter sp.]|uniref:OmpA family protein n=1 Tax=Trichlorobacter sp. TaxID=2911007 RepID=UPI00256D1473|nr:OmpA family protein [Trichlorobacter sp.]MDK9716450.1 OmpA family protein [Trichlorobacter sp.]
MHKMMKHLVPLGLLLVASSASAGIRQGEFSISPVLGGYSYEGQQHLDTNLVFGGRAGYMLTKNLGVEGLFDYVNPELTGGKKDISMYRYGGELLYHFMPDNTFVPYIAAGFAGLKFDGANATSKNTYGAADYGVGAKYFLTDRFALRADVRHIMYNLSETVTHNVEYTVGAYIPFGGAAPAVKPIEVAPAPEPIKVEAPKPSAPKAFLHATPQNITSGEQSTLQWSSSNAKNCSIQPAIGSVSLSGFTTVSPTADAEYTLTCKGEGGEATSKTAVAVKPVPVVQPAPPAPVVEQSAAKASAAQLCSPTVLNIKFDTNKTAIKPAYQDELAKLGTFLKDNPGAKGSIEGHTDSVGNKKANMKLSQRRADSVRSYIIKKSGIDASRITAQGFGPTKPIADNKTAAGKAKNRRIEANFSCE